MIKVRITYFYIYHIVIFSLEDWFNLSNLRFSVSLYQLGFELHQCLFLKVLKAGVRLRHYEAGLFVGV
jgi:hypothetical protein